MSGIKTLKEVIRLLEENEPVERETAAKWILREYDRYARIMGWSSYAAYKEWCEEQRTTHATQPKP